MSTKRYIDPAGLLPDYVTITPDGDKGDSDALRRLLRANTPAARIERLRQHPELCARADEPDAMLDNGNADKQCLEAIAQAEHKALYLKAAPHAIQSRGYSQTQSVKGGKGAEARWSNPNDDARNDIIASLAKHTDALGDDLPPAELWGPLFAELEAKELNPQDNGDFYSYDGGSISYQAFRVQINRKR